MNWKRAARITTATVAGTMGAGLVTAALALIAGTAVGLVVW